MNQRVNLPKIFRRMYLSDINPDILKSKAVTIFGIGGIGTLVAEMLARVGVGKLILVDKDVVEEENMNRLGFYPEDLGSPKVDVIGNRLRRISELRGPKYAVTIETYLTNIFDFEDIERVISESDCVVSALDCVDARLEVNLYAVKHRKILIDSGASTNGLRGRVTVVKPFEWPCLNCYYSNDSMVEEGLFDDVTCNVSLPTTMALIASLQVDQCLKVLLNRQGVVPLILVNLEEEPQIIVYDKLNRRKDCSFCGY
ncbi:MAG: ThiF family adenylyltransferase [Crenarchaeota archaeon]|nr:ThiF family adenylyltransferase [Thermoproteota archaeon]MCR8473360.1 ThiF family adenylyltransferase [Thermoproteota archaeon]MCR8487348.1 ThiF family adenylyltransferase [Thermoproteota archaeon]